MGRRQQAGTSQSGQAGPGELDTVAVYALGFLSLGGAAGGYLCGGPGTRPREPREQEGGLLWGVLGERLPGGRTSFSGLGLDASPHYYAG